MQILVTGGTGVIGETTVLRLLQRGHSVRLLTRHPDRAWSEWGNHLSVHAGDVSDDVSLRKAAETCDAVLHMAGIVAEEGALTFDAVNVQGTAHVLEEAVRSRARRFVYVSSLGADRGASPYHVSKRKAEELVRTFKGEWLIVRPGNVFGPGDQVISLLLKIVRSMPVVPLIDGGNHPFQPVWHEDLAEALAVVVEREDLRATALDLSGEERTSLDELIDILSRITKRKPVRIPLSGGVATLTLKFAAALGIEVPVDPGQITMLREGNVVEGMNALVDLLGVTPTPLEVALRKLADSLPENLPSDGVGPLREKLFWADIIGSRMSCQGLFDYFCEHFAEIMPIDVGVEPGTPTRIAEGLTITMKLPLRGNVQVRVEQIDENSVTLATLEGHPIAGTVRFRFIPRGESVCFEIQVLDRSGNLVDLLAMESFGQFVQDTNWMLVVERVVKASGGTAAGGIQRDVDKLRGDAAEAVERWAEEVRAERKREVHDEEIGN